MANLTILVDNYVRAKGLLAQHGFALWCEAGSNRILFDTGAEGDVLRSNAEHLGVDLSTATDIVLSHGHWDHGGGLDVAMDLCSSARIWIPSGALLPRWHRSKSGNRDIALPQVVRSRLIVERKRWQEVSEPVELGSGIWITGPVPGARPDWTHRDLWRNELLDIPDDVPEEQAMVLDMPDGMVVVAGCAHYGIDNLLDRLGSLFPGRPLVSLVGGMHLESAPTQVVDRMVERLVAMGSRCLVPCHCSGWAAQARLHGKFGADCEPGMVGKRLQF
ncbi:MAG TPA: MBL fold metallo-hydrolase [Fibrobacteria bacterium]|nr:MBL fold metallo-hydrolase [Fibrobacteria bacterium]